MRNIYTGCSGSKVPKITASNTQKFRDKKNLEHNFVFEHDTFVYKWFLFHFCVTLICKAYIFEDPWNKPFTLEYDLVTQLFFLSLLKVIVYRKRCPGGMGQHPGLFRENADSRQRIQGEAADKRQRSFCHWQDRQQSQSPQSQRNMNSGFNPLVSDQMAMMDALKGKHP